MGVGDRLSGSAVVAVSLSNLIFGNASNIASWVQALVLLAPLQRVLGSSASASRAEIRSSAHWKTSAAGSYVPLKC